MDQGELLLIVTVVDPTVAPYSRVVEARGGRQCSPSQGHTLQLTIHYSEELSGIAKSAGRLSHFTVRKQWRISPARSVQTK